MEELGPVIGVDVPAHPDDVRLLASWIDNDGTPWLVSGGDDGTIHRWNAMTAQRLGRPLAGHHGPVMAATFWQADDTTYLASAGLDGMVRRWHAATGEPIGEPIAAHSGAVLAIGSAQEPGGAPYLISGGEDGVINRWDATTGQPLGGVISGGREVVALALLESEERIGTTHLVTGDEAGRVRLWATTDRGTTLSRELTPALQGSVSAIVAFHRDGEMYVAAGGEAGTIHRWNATTNQLLDELWDSPEGPVLALDTWADAAGETYLACGGDEGNVRVWNATSGRPTVELHAHTGDSVRALASWRTDGVTYLASGDSAGAIRRWRASTGEPWGAVMSVQRPVLALEAVSRAASGSPLLFSGGDDGTVRRWDATTGEAVGEPLSNSASWILALASWRDDDGIFLAGGGSDGVIGRWNAINGQPLDGPSPGHTDWIVAMTTWRRRDGTTCLASGGDDGTIRRWDATTGRALEPPLDCGSPVLAVAAWESDGGITYLAAGGENGTIHRWNLVSGQPLGDVLGSGEMGRVLALTTWTGADGAQYLAAGGDDGSIRRWNAATGAPLKAIHGPGGRVSALASWLSDDDSIHIASGSSDGTISVWDAESGASLDRAITPHRSVVALSTWRNQAGEIRIASAGSEGTIRRWRLDQALLTGSAHPTVDEDPTVTAQPGGGESGLESAAVTPPAASPTARPAGDSPTGRDLINRADAAREIALILDELLTTAAREALTPPDPTPMATPDGPAGKLLPARRPGAKQPFDWPGAEARRPLTVSVLLDSPWGAGKTSFIHLVQDALEELRVRGATSRGADADGTPTTGLWTWNTRRSGEWPPRAGWTDTWMDAWRDGRLGPGWWVILRLVRRATHERSARHWLSSRTLGLREFLHRFRGVARWTAILALILITAPGLSALTTWLLEAVDHASNAQVGEGVRHAASTAVDKLHEYLNVPGLSKMDPRTFQGIVVAAAAILALERWARWWLPAGSRLQMRTSSEPLAAAAGHVRWLRRHAAAPMLLTIDELDRCDRRQAVEILDAAQLLLRAPDHEPIPVRCSERAHRWFRRVTRRPVPGLLSADSPLRNQPPFHEPVVLFVAADRRWLRVAYDEEHSATKTTSDGRWTEASRLGSSPGDLFLEKVFDLTITVPNLNARQLELLAASLVGPAADDSPTAPTDATSRRRPLGRPPLRAAATQDDTPSPTSHTHPPQPEPSRTPTSPIDEIHPGSSTSGAEDLSAPSLPSAAPEPSPSTERPATPRTRASEDSDTVPAPSQSVASTQSQLLTDPRFTDLLPRNPRALKRVANRLCVDRAMVLAQTSSPTPVVTLDSEFGGELAYWAIVSVRWPLLAEYLAAAAWLTSTNDALSDWPKGLFAPPKEGSDPPPLLGHPARAEAVAVLQHDQMARELWIDPSALTDFRANPTQPSPRPRISPQTVRRVAAGY